jgi:hypothetical protein
MSIETHYMDPSGYTATSVPNVEGSTVASLSPGTGSPSARLQTTLFASGSTQRAPQSVQAILAHGASFADGAALIAWVARHASFRLPAFGQNDTHPVPLR